MKRLSFICLAALWSLWFSSFNLYAIQASYHFDSVDAATAHPWQALDIGAVVHTYHFNSPVTQTWRVQSEDPALQSGFGVKAGDYWLNLNYQRRGVTLSELGGIPTRLDPNFDNVPVWERAQQLDVPIILDDIYAGHSSFEISKSGVNVQGLGVANTGLLGLDPYSPVLITRMGQGSESLADLHLQGFSIRGVGSAALVMTHMSVSFIDNISLSGFDGGDGYVFEYMWGNKIGLLTSNGATLSGSPFKWNRGVLDTVFEHLYSSNLVDVNFDFDNSRQEYSNPAALGDGVNTIMLMTAQGADVVAIKINGLSRYKILNVYTENCQEILHVSGAVSDIAISGDFQGVRSTTERSVWLDGNLSGISLNDVSFPDELIEIGKINADIQLDSPRVTGNKDIVSLLRRNANTPSSMPLSIDYQVTSMSRKLMKTDGWSWKFRSMFVDNNGNWQSELITIPLM